METTLPDRVTPIRSRTSMARRRRGRPVSGILLLDKPVGLSSNQALQQVKRMFDAAKAGHTGSLDPLASGVLPLCLGEATKFSQYLLDADKAYDTTVVLGQSTATGDAEGEVLATKDATALQREALEVALEGFRGEIEQRPSMYSALKHEGQPLYKLARAGKEVERKLRRVHIRELQLQAFTPGELARVELSLRCSKGTYVRSIAEDLGEALQLGGYVAALRRTVAGPFKLSQAFTIEQLRALLEAEGPVGLDRLLLPADAALGSLPWVRLTESGGFYLRRGQAVLVPNAPGSGMVRVGLETGEFLGVGEVLDDGRVAPRRLVVTGG